jgi:predicted nucleic acid-binding protein
VTTAYIDSSFLLAIALGEPRAAGLRRTLAGFDRLLSSDLMIAECLSTALREGIDRDAMLVNLRPIALVLPPRTLQREAAEALDEGYLRGADLWHVACALFIASDARSDVAFLSRDEPQRRIARRLGFPTP